VTAVDSRPAAGAPHASAAERRFADRMVNEHGDYDDWCPATWAAYRAGIAACRTAETPVLTLSQAADAGLLDLSATTPAARTALDRRRRGTDSRWTA
jgi:hypothetical protein